MIKNKWKISVLAVACALCSSVAVASLPNTVGASEVGGVLTTGDDFTKPDASKGILSNVVYDRDKGNSAFGAVTGSAWGATVSGGDGTITYTLTADEGYCLKDATILFDAGVGHQGGVFWYNGSVQGGTDVLGANIRVSYSVDGGEEKFIYNLDEDENHPIRTHEEATDVNYRFGKDGLKITTLGGGSELTVRFYLDQFTAEETVHWANSGIALTNAGISFYNTNISATQTKIGNLSVGDDFTTAGGTGLANGNLYSYQGVTTDGKGHDDFGVIPAEAWGASVVLRDDSELVYQINATNGYYIESLKGTLNVRYGHDGIPAQYAKSDVKVAISYDGENYQEIYSLRADESICADGEVTPKGAGLTQQIKPYTITLDKKVNPCGELFVKILLCSPAQAELQEAHGLATLNLQRIGTNLMKTNFELSQKRIQDKTVESDWGLGGVVDSFAGVYDSDNVIKDTVGGNATYGLIPAEVWGAYADISTGYVTYHVASDAGNVFGSMKMGLTYKYFARMDAFTEGNANITVSVSYDGKNFAEAYNLFKEKGIGSSDAVSQEEIDLSAWAKDHTTLYIKVTMAVPDTAQISLGNIPACILGVNIVGKQALAPSGSVAINNEFGQDKRLALTENFAGLIEASGVIDGNYTFGLIPSTAWGDPVTAGDGQLVYQLSAGKDKVFSNLRFNMAYKLREGANIVVSVSADGSTYSEFYNAVSDRGNKAYDNNLTRISGKETIAYQIVDRDMKALVENESVVYVKVAVTHPQGTFYLGNLLADIFSVNFFGATSVEEWKGGRIYYDLAGGAFESVAPDRYMQGDETVTLIAPVKPFMTFVGWYDNQECTGEPITQIQTDTVKNWRLYAKWEKAVYTLSVAWKGDGNADLTVNGEAFTGNEMTVEGGENVAFALKAKDSNSLVVSLSFDGVDAFLTNEGEYTLRKVGKNTSVVVTVNKRAEITGDFAVDYADNVKYGNGWKKGLYDYANLYITDDSYHALGNDNGVGYLTYKFVAEEGKTFGSAMLETTAKLFDYFCMGTNERVDYYVSDDNADYQLIYKSAITRVGDNIQTIRQNLTEYVYGKKEFFLKIEVGSNSANWTLLQNMSITFEYERVELEIFYGNFYSELCYGQYKGMPFDISLLAPKAGYALSSYEVYTDSACTQALDLSKPVTGNMKVYLKCVEADGAIIYHLNGGENASENLLYYKSDSETVLHEPTRAGYAFDGWYADEACSLLVSVIAQGRTGDVELYAKWLELKTPDVAVEYLITYELNGGENNAENPESIRAGEQIALKDATKSGYTFEGWFDSAGKQYVAVSYGELEGDLTLIARFSDGAENPPEENPPAENPPADNPSEEEGCASSTQGVGVIAFAFLGAVCVAVKKKKGKAE